MVYDCPDLYAAAYGFRDIAAELDFALAQAQVALGRAATSLVELAAGPALHARCALDLGLRAAAVEHNPQAVDWLRCTEPRLEVVLADIAAFKLAAPVDVALCPLSGFAYLLTDAAWLAALDSVAQSLTPGGLLVAELAPDDARRVEVDRWEVPAGDGVLEVVAGPSRMLTDGVFEWDLQITARRDGQPVTLHTIERQRDLSAAAVGRLLAQHGGFQAVRCYEGYDRRRRYRGAGSLVVCARRADPK